LCLAHAFIRHKQHSSALPDESWSLDGTKWWPEYDYKLGEPLGEATVSADGWTYTRSFASGTHVTVDVENHEYNLHWAQ
jgi:hypothetical protein